jgi:tRNA G18 (ribose-2'-O)-methylase SpoU
MATIEYITNLAAPDLQDFVSLTDVALRKKIDPASGLYIAESPKVIRRALEAGHIPRAVLLKEQWLEEMAELFLRHSCKIYVGDDDVLEDLTGFHMHRGALASFHRPELPSLKEVLETSSCVVILENIVDHTNVGAIFRAVAGLGADAVLITPQCADPLYRRSVRVSMASVLQVPWTRIPAWDEASGVLHDAGFHITALALTDSAVPLKDFVQRAPAKLALVLGAEGDGLSYEALSHADSVVSIPMHHGVDSLNVAAASAVALYALTTRNPQEPH